MKQSTIGMIGIGMMGKGIASNLLAKGWKLAFLDHPGNQPVDDLVAAGATRYASAAALAANSNTIILCVTGTPEVEDALTRQDGILSGIRPGSLIIDCSTAIPESTMRLATRIAEAGCRFLDAPMTRTPKEAAEGRLNLIVGGDETEFRQQLPLLQAFAENIIHAGPVGAGHRMKLLHNFVSLGFSAVLAEAAACAARGGVSPQTLIEVLARGGGAGVILDRLKPYILDGDPSGMRFSLSNAHKDLSYYTAMAEQEGAEAGTAIAIRELFRRSKGDGTPVVPELVTLLGEGILAEPGE